MSAQDSTLAVLLRKAQWMLDDAAFEVGGGRFGTADRQALAEALGELADTLRAYRNDEAATTDTADNEPVRS